MTIDKALEEYLPGYLTLSPKQREFLVALHSLAGRASAHGYFLQKFFDQHGDVMMQGDGWSEFQVFSFKSGKRSSVDGIILSNSCDISLGNKRARPPKVTFAPIVKLSAVRARFEEWGFNAQQIKGRLKAIREQSPTATFYLPANGPLDEEHVVFLDDLHSIQVSLCEKSKKLFRLSEEGHYLLIFKLSVHFCRRHGSQSTPFHMGAS